MRSLIVWIGKFDFFSGFFGSLKINNLEDCFKLVF